MNDYLLARARTLFACYRKDETHDPESYIAAVAAVLGDGYTRSVVEYVTDPRTGIPATQKFLPAVAEVKASCDARAAHIERMNRYSELRPVAPQVVETKPGQITYKQYLERQQASGAKGRPIGAFEKGGYLGPRE